MPTHSESATFTREFKKLSREQREGFADALEKFIEDLAAKESDPGCNFRPGLRVKPFQSGPHGVLEMTWADNGRALFRFGDAKIAGKLHVDWLRIGTHDIF